MLNFRRHGFTLIEILIVCAIIGLIAAISVPAVMRSRAKTKLSNCEQNLRSIAHACDAYINDYSENALANVGDAKLMTELADKGYLPDDLECPCDGTYAITTYEATTDNVSKRKKYGDYVVTCVDGDHTLAGCDDGNYPFLTGQGEFIHTATEDSKL